MSRSVLIVLSILMVLTGCNNKDNNASTVQTPLPEPALPEAPTGLSTRAEDDRSVRLAWQDNGNHETYFHIERSDDGITFISIAEVAGDMEEYLDTDLGAGEYTYRVNASNDEGITDYSNESQVRLWTVDACRDTAVADPALSSGRFYIMPIYGLSYLTPSHASFTDNNGRFYFGNAPRTQFYLGYTPVGSIANAPYVRFPDLAASLGSTSLDDRIALNLLSLLQTLDSDDDVFNGIQIPCTVSMLPYREIDFSLHESNFSRQPGIETMIAGKPWVSNVIAGDNYETLRKSFFAGTYSVSMTFNLGVYPVTFAFTMTVNELGELVLNNIDPPASLSFDPVSGNFSLLYLDLEAILYYFILSGMGIDLSDLVQYYPWKFTLNGNIQPDHTISGSATLYTLSGNYNAEISGVRQ